MIAALKTLVSPMSLGALAVLFLAGLSLGVKLTADHYQARESKAVTAALDKYKRDTAAGQAVSTKTEADRQKIVYRTKEIVRNVPIYVTKKADAGCVIPVGFVGLHNAAAENRDPAPAGNPDAPAQGITLAAVAGTVSENYGTCHEIRNQLIGFQAWARGQWPELEGR